MQAADLSPQQTAVAVLGHGTRRSDTTRSTTQKQAESVRQAGLAAEVVDAYLDDDPDIPSIYTRTSAPNIIAVPYFLAPGSHVTIDVPDALGINYGETPAQPTKIEGRTVYYTPPIGTDDVILDVILKLAWATGVVFEPNNQPLWSHFPQAGAESLIEAVQRRGTVIFGQLQLTSDAVRPIDSSDAHTFTTPADLRRHLRENPFRPLASSDDLPLDWVVPVAAIQQLPAIVETVYPGALADWAHYQGNFVQPVTLSTLVNRQQGMYRELSALSDAAIAHFVSGVCGRCIKHPLWHDSTIPGGAVPCLSPCNMFLASAKEALVDER
jgi:sirohydrochlorin cobaltochelatase